jgi:hypothetical protein
MPELPKNKFFDINKLPKEYGLLVFPISISRIDYDNGQSPGQCLEFIECFSPKKINEPKVGLNMIYGDFLYMNSIEPASTLKDRFMNMVMRHKNGFHKLVLKNWEKFQIQQAFSYEVWNQLYLDYKGSFDEELNSFRKTYDSDEYFQKLLKDDAEFCKRELTKEQETFFLEEFLMMYLITKKQVFLPNEYVQGREKWILNAYPGPQLKGQIYTYQKNFLKLSAPDNEYENCAYDLTSKKLVDFTRIDLETYNYTYDS